MNPEYKILGEGGWDEKITLGLTKEVDFSVEKNPVSYSTWIMGSVNFTVYDSTHNSNSSCGTSGDVIVSTLEYQTT